VLGINTNKRYQGPKKDHHAPASRWAPPERNERSSSCGRWRGSRSTPGDLHRSTLRQSPGEEGREIALTARTFFILSASTIKWSSITGESMLFRSGITCFLSDCFPSDRETSRGEYVINNSVEQLEKMRDKLIAVVSSKQQVYGTINLARKDLPSDNKTNPLFAKETTRHYVRGSEICTKRFTK